MSHPNSVIKSYVAEAAVEACRIVKYGAADGQVLKGAAAADKLVGVAAPSVDSAIGDQVDVVKSGPAEVRLGGAVARGDLLTSDANGKAVVWAPAAGANARYVAIADASGVLDDIIPCTVMPGIGQG